MTTLLRAACLLACLLVPRAALEAQPRIAFLGGLGYSSTEGNVSLGKSVKQAGVQAGAAALPVAVRADVILFGGTWNVDALSLIGNLVVVAPTGRLRPYAIAGRGRYATSLTGRVTGWSYGGGVCLRLGPVSGIAEMRRHAPVGRSITALGVSWPGSP